MVIMGPRQIISEGQDGNKQIAKYPIAEIQKPTTISCMNNVCNVSVSSWGWSNSECHPNIIGTCANSISGPHRSLTLTEYSLIYVLEPMQYSPSWWPFPVMHQYSTLNWKVGLVVDLYLKCTRSSST